MSDMGLDEPDIEAPDADAAEQHLDAVPEPDTNDEAPEVAEPPLEVNAADAAEQARVVRPDDDEYR
jgi:hypothetical protein